MSDTATNVANAEAGTSNINGQHFRFPSEAISGGMWLNLTEFEYQRPVSTGYAQPKPTGALISLPIPMNLRSSYDADWDTNETFMATTKLLSDAIGNNLNAFNDPGAWIMQKLSNPQDPNHSKIDAIINGVQSIGSGATEAAKAIATDIFNALPVVRAVGAIKGVARNPWLAATFKGMNFRQFQFEYKFFPVNYDESVTIDNIITQMKYGMAPSYQPGFENNLFIYPNMYLPTLVPNDYLFSFGFCVITKVDVNYHAQGAPVYHNKDGKKIPAAIDLGFTLQEIEVITKETIRPPNINSLTGGAIPGNLQSNVIQGTNRSR